MSYTIFGVFDKIDQGKYARKQVKTNNYMTSNNLARESGETISLKNLQF